MDAGPSPPPRRLLAWVTAIAVLAAGLAAGGADASRWTSIGTLPGPLAEAASAFDGRTAYLIGGIDGNGTFSDAVFAVDVQAGTTERIGTLTPSDPTEKGGRMLMGAAYLSGKVYAFGGIGVHNQTIGGRDLTLTRDFSDIYEIDPETRTVTALADRLPERLLGMGVATFEGKAYLFGGESFDALETTPPGESGNSTAVVRDTIVRFDPSAPLGHRLTRLDVHLPHGSMQAGVARVGDVAYIMGGLETRPDSDPCPDLAPGQPSAACPTREILAFDLKKETILGVVGQLPEPYERVHAAVLLDEILVVGGQANHTQRTILRIDPRDPSHATVMRATLPAPLYANGLVWNDTLIWTLGGYLLPKAYMIPHILEVDPFDAPSPLFPPDAETTSDGSTIITWRPPAYDGGAPPVYSIYQDDGTGPKPIGTTNATRWVRPGTALGSFAIEASVLNHYSGLSASTRPGAPPPPGPQLAAIVTPTSTRIEWTAPAVDPSDQNVSIFRDARLVTRLAGNATSWSDPNATPGDLRGYAVRREGPTYDGRLSEIVVAAPGNGTQPPAGLRADIILSAPSRVQARVAWSASAGAETYAVFRARGDEPPSLVVVTNARSYTEDLVGNETDLAYSVASLVNGTGGPPSAPVTLHEPGPLGPPQNVQARLGEIGVELSWDPPANLPTEYASTASYEIMRTNDDGTPTDLGSHAQERLLDGAPPAGNLSYTVRLVDPLVGAASPPIVVVITTDVQRAIAASSPPDKPIGPGSGGASPSPQLAIALLGLDGKDVDVGAAGADLPAGTTLRWDWGDGTSSTGADAHHAYAAPGTYTLEATAILPNGTRWTATKSIEIPPPSDDVTRAATVGPAGWPPRVWVPVAGGAILVVAIAGIVLVRARRPGR